MSEDQEHQREDWLDGVVRELRRPVRVHANFDRRVMAAIHVIVAAPSWSLGRPFGWRVSVTLTPLRALALAAGLAACIVGGAWLLSRSAAAPGRTDEAGPAERIVQFVIVAPSASQVTLVGDFNDWDPSATPMRPAAAGGVWSVSVPLLAGRYQYAFVINGTEWKADPAAPAAPVDDFGARNSIITVSGQAS